MASSQMSFSQEKVLFKIRQGWGVSSGATWSVMGPGEPGRWGGPHALPSLIGRSEGSLSPKLEDDEK